MSTCGSRPVNAGFSLIRWAGASCLIGALAACGGGGGASSPDATVAITLSNRDTISHAVAAGMFAVGSAGAIQADLPAAAADRRQALAVGRPHGGAAWTERVTALLTARAAHREVLRTRLAVAQALSDPVTENCAVSGSLTVAVDDRDNSGTASAGDMLSIVFDQCRDTADETVNGSVHASLLAVDEAASSLSARLVLTALSDATSRHSLTIAGTLVLDLSMAASPGAVMVTQLTADGPVTVGVQTHLPFSDTVTLQDGWSAIERYDPNVGPVAGNVEAGRTTLSVTGRLASQAAGGVIQIRSTTALASYGEDSNPRSGVLHIEGQTGALQLSALSVDEVRIDLDANDDGQWESTTTESWDWLL